MKKIMLFSILFMAMQIPLYGDSSNGFKRWGKLPHASKIKPVCSGVTRASFWQDKNNVEKACIFLLDELPHSICDSLAIDEKKVHAAVEEIIPLATENDKKREAARILWFAEEICYTGDVNEKRWTDVHGEDS